MILPKLLRSLSFFDAFAIVVGSMVGTGVFLKSATMTQQLGSGVWVLAAWAVAGLLSCAGAFTYAEIGGRYPQAGGEYIFLREVYGSLPAFLYGWARFWIASAASIAAYGVGAATFLAGAVDLGTGYGRTFVALAIIIVYTLLNCLAVSFGGKIQSWMTAVKLLLIILFIAGVMVAIPPGKGHLHTLVMPEAQSFSLSAFLGAMVAALWAFDGWNNLPMAAGEVKNPQRNVPLALATGTTVVLLLYLFTNLTYFHALPLPEVANANSHAFPHALPVAAKASQEFLGFHATMVFSLVLVFSALGSLNGSILAGARVPYAMACDGLFFRRFANVSARSHVPTYAILAQGAWSCVLALSGSFDQLTDAVVFSSWIFYGLVTLSVFSLRKKLGPPKDTLRMWGYPAVPCIFLVATVFLLGNSIISAPHESLAGLGFIALGVPCYWYFQRRLKPVSK